MATLCHLADTIHQGGYYPPAAQNPYGQMPYVMPTPDPYYQMMQFSQGLMHDNYSLQNQLYSASNIISELEYKINQKTEKILVNLN